MNFVFAEWGDEAVSKAEILRLIYQGTYYKLIYLNLK